MELSYWEKEIWFNHIDFTIVGSGIVGLNCAITIKNKYPRANILILEKGTLPQGASTKNAGFACFGSISELLEDLKNSSEQEVYSLVEKRWKGLQKLRNTIGDTELNYENNKGYELFLKTDTETYRNVYKNKITLINCFTPFLIRMFLVKKKIVLDLKTLKTHI